MAYLLRLRVEDRPGMLGEVAGAIGRIGGDIESISVVEREAGTAVDDLVVELPRDMLAERLYTALAGIDGVVVEALLRHAGRAKVRDELELLDAAAAAAEPLQILVEGLPGLMAASWAIALDVNGLVAASLGAPELPPLKGIVPLAGAGELPVERLYDDAMTAGADCALIGAPVGPRAAVVLARNGGAPFRPVEALRLAHLGNVVALARRTA